MPGQSICQRNLVLPNTMKARMKRPATAPVPTDTLSSRALDLAFFGGTGLPDLADALAYDPVQRLLAVRPTDGYCLPFS